MVRTICSNLLLCISIICSAVYSKKKIYPDSYKIICYLNHLFKFLLIEHPSGCSDGTSDGLAGYEEIQACKGKWIGHVKRGMQIVIVMINVPYLQEIYRD